jgi:hypothetical protein
VIEVAVTDRPARTRSRLSLFARTGSHSSMNGSDSETSPTTPIVMGVSL